MLGGAALVSGLLFRVSYVAREFMIALAGLGLVYSAVLLILVLGYLVWRGAAGTFSWLRVQTQHWNRATGEWVYVFTEPRPVIAKQAPRIP